MSPATEELFRQARERGDIEKESGVKRGRRGRCPMCGEGRKRDDAFSHHGKTGLWKCFRGCGQGDAITLVAQMRGFDRLTAARWILGLPLDGSGDPAGPPAPLSKEEQARRDAERAERARQAARSAELSEAYHARVIAELDASAVSAEGSRGVRAWLGVARGLPVAQLAGAHAGELLHDALGQLGAVRDAHYFEDFDARIVHRHPAMLATIEADGLAGTIGRHVTYLTRDGLAKIDAPDARKVWGSNRGAVWLTERDAALGPLFVAEGIETALSMLAGWRTRHGAGSGRALAVLSLDNFQGGWAVDAWGRMDAARPRADRTRPAVTFSAASFPEGRVGRVILGPDHDMKPLRRVKIRKPEGGTATIDLDATQRMEIAALLAAFWWRLAGAEAIDIARPPLGMDFNDAWRAEHPASAAA